MIEDPAIKGAALNDCSVKGGKYVANWRVSKPVIRDEKCASCGLCVAYCPEASVTQEENHRPLIDYRFCKGCGICAYECPQEAIEMVKEDQL
ncbi:MAG: 4Fe-4S dicluster domain-containing protein [Candidatus Bathyarchaeota archaeon]